MGFLQSANGEASCKAADVGLETSNSGHRNRCAVDSLVWVGAFFVCVGICHDTSRLGLLRRESFPFLGASLVLARGPGGAATTTAPALSPGALHEQIVQRYLAAEWEELAGELPKETKVVAAMTKEEQGDVTYIRQALAEGRPVWWDQVKKGREDRDAE